jgi:hypothetical protein
VTEVGATSRPGPERDRAAMTATVARLRSEIADLERLMVDMPPHHAGGTRRGVEERLEDLRRALQRSERTAKADVTGEDDA